MSFRDDFNTLDTSVWEIRNTIPSKATVQVVNGNLDLSISNLVQADGNHELGIRTLNPLNLVNAQVDMPVKLFTPYQYLWSRFGVAVTNVPFAFVRDAPVNQRGVWMGIINFTEFVWIEGMTINADKMTLYGRKDINSLSDFVRMRIGKKCVYFYEVSNGEEFFFHNVPAPIDFSSCYLAIYLIVYPLSDNLTQRAQTDYIQTSPYNVVEGTPYMSFGQDVKPPDLPPEVLYTLLGNMIPIMVGNSLLSIAERVKK